MADQKFPELTSPLRIGPITIRNRMVFTGHDSLLQHHDGSMSDAYIAYQVARARGGAGVQMLGAAAIDAASGTTEHQLKLDTDAVIPGLRRMADAVHAEGGKVFTQMLHAGREVYRLPDGTAPLTYSASATPSERFRVIPREMPKAMIREVIASYAAAARRTLEGGMDGVELVANQGNLPAQFLSGQINRRTDEYGGDIQKRLRFIVEVAEAVRETIGDRIAFGVRLSATDIDLGVAEDESLALCKALDARGLVDYVSLVLGSTGTRGGAMHIAASMAEKTGYVAPYAERIKREVGVPVIATGRFNTPQSANEAIRTGQTDACGMTRAMIADPQLANKVVSGRLDDIRACIGCDQACIGHYQKDASISCIQFPESGRELKYGTYPPIARRRKILVAGGGPAGMKAAAVAAVRGHQVILCEAESQLGGQVRLGERLPTRAEFGGVVTNLQREMELAGVEVRRNTRVDRALVEREKPDAIVIATGGRTKPADPENIQDAHVVTADDFLRGANVGKRVVIADARADWIGIGVAEKLAAEGHHVRLVVAAPQPGEFIPLYVRDNDLGRLFSAGVEVTPNARLFGADGETVYFEQFLAHKPMVMEDADTLIACFGQVANMDLEQELEDLDIERHVIGDCLTPRTAEEAILEGLKTGVAL